MNASAPEGQKNETILVVDDDPIALAVARERLERVGYSVVTRDGIVGTANAVAGEKPAALLLDMMMPGLGGEGVANVLRKDKRTKDVNIILYTSLDLKEVKPVATRIHAAGVIEKTPDSEAFDAQFQRIMRRIRLLKGATSSPD